MPSEEGRGSQGGEAGTRNSYPLAMPPGRSGDVCRHLESSQAAARKLGLATDSACPPAGC